MKNLHILPTDKPSRLYKSKITQDVFISDNMSQHGDATYNVNVYITSDEEIKEGDYFLYDETEIRYKTNGTEYHGRDLCHISGNRRYPVNKSKKIILTTDQSLDGVQKIDDDFLQWFVKNPSCEEVDLDTFSMGDKVLYNVVFPKEEQKQHLIDIMRGDEELGLYEEPKQDYSGVHLRHCYQGEYEDGCKYGEDDCPAKPLEEPKQKTLEKLAKEYYPDESKLMEMMERIAFKRGYTECKERMYSEAIEFAEWIRIKDFQTTSKDNWIGLNMEYYTTQELFEQFKKK